MPDSHLPTFPQEIFDHIIEFTQNDRDTLATTSLVSSNWLLTSRQYLFRSVSLQPRTLEAFSNIVSNSPTFLSHVRELIIKPSYKYVNCGCYCICLNNQILSWFPQFPRATSLIIDKLKWESEEVLHSFSSLMPSITTLDLRVRRYRSPDFIKHILSAFPSLTTLIYSGYPSSSHNFMNIPFTPNRLSDSSGPFLPALKTLHFEENCTSWNFFMTSIPLESLQLSELKVMMPLMLNDGCLQNLVPFMRHHCLGITSLTLIMDDESTFDKDEARECKCYPYSNVSLTTLISARPIHLHLLRISLTSQIEDYHLLCRRVHCRLPLPRMVISSPPSTQSRPQPISRVLHSWYQNLGIRMG